MTLAERDNLVLSCDGLAVTLAKQWSRSVRGMDVFDLAQEARAELLRQAHHFDPRRGSWKSFARTCIARHFNGLRLTGGNLIRHPRAYGMALASARKLVRHGERPEVAAERIAQEKRPLRPNWRASLARLLRRDLNSRRVRFFDLYQSVL